MNTLRANLENAIATYLAATLTAPATVYASLQAGEEETQLPAVMVAMESAEEMPQGTGNYSTALTIGVISAADTEAAEEAEAGANPLTAHATLYNEVFTLVKAADFHDQINAQGETLTVWPPVIDAGIMREIENRRFIETITLIIYAAPAVIN